MTRVYFGTYNTTNEDLERMFPHIIEAGISEFDTAQLYHNEKQLNKLISQYKYTCSVTTKMGSKKNVGTHLINKSTNIFGSNQYITNLNMLLHNPSPSRTWLDLESSKK